MPAIAQAVPSISKTQVIAQSTAAVKRVTGHYVVDGKAPNGKFYSGVAWIQPAEEGTVRIDWSLTRPEYEGFSSFVGTGRFQADGTLKVVYAGSIDGTQTFIQKQDGTLESSFTEVTGTGTERFILVGKVIRR